MILLGIVYKQERDNIMLNYNILKNRDTTSRAQTMDFNVLSVDALLSDDTLGKFIQTWNIYQKPRLVALKDYYNANNAGIMAREPRGEGKHDYRTSSTFARQISEFLTDYSISNPMQIDVKETENKDHARLDEVNSFNDINTENYDVYKDMSIYGRAFELIYRDEDDISNIVRLSPENTFVIRDATVKHRIIAGIRQVVSGTNVDITGQATSVYTYILYTPDEIITFEAVGEGQSFSNQIASREVNPFGKVPIVEYRNDETRMGDFEHVTDLIDLYDYIIADTGNFMSDLPNATLEISGAKDLLMGGIDDLSTTPEFQGGTGFEEVDTDESNKQDDEQKLIIEQNKRARKQAQVLKTISNSSVRFLQSYVDPATNTVIPTTTSYSHPDFDTSSTTSILGVLRGLIYQGSFTPDLSDEHFSGVSSGESIKYKLMNTIQRAIQKERHFEKGLRERYTLVDIMENDEIGWNFKIENLTFTFNDGVKTDTNTTLDTLGNLGLKYPQKIFGWKIA